MSSVKDIQKIFEQDAALLGDYQSMSKTELANGYSDARQAYWKAEAEGNEEEMAHQDCLRSWYWSALMLRYWYKIWEWMKNSKSLMLDDTDFIDWLSDGLWVAFYYETWRYEYQAVVKEGKFIEWKLDKNGNKIPNPYYWKIDPNAPDKMINRCCLSIRGKYYQYYNKDKRKAGVQTYSLDNMIDEEGDYAVNVAGCVTKDEHIYDSPVYALINAFASRNELLESLVVDGIANGDSFKEVTTIQQEELWDDDEKDYVVRDIEKVSHQFDERKLVKHLSHLDEEYILKFCAIYDLSIDAKQLYEKLKKTSNTKLYKLIEKVKIEVKESPYLSGLAR